MTSDDLKQFLEVCPPNVTVLVDSGNWEDAVYSRFIARHLRTLDPDGVIGIITTESTSELLFNTTEVDLVLGVDASQHGSEGGFDPAPYVALIREYRPDLTILSPSMTISAHARELAAARGLSMAQAEAALRGSDSLFDALLCPAMGLAIPHQMRRFSLTLPEAAAPFEAPVTIGVDLEPLHPLSDEARASWAAAMQRFVDQGFDLVYFSPEPLALPGRHAGALAPNEAAHLIASLTAFIGAPSGRTFLALGCPNLPVFLYRNPGKFLTLNMQRRHVYSIQSMNDALSPLLILTQRGGTLASGCFFLENGFVFHQEEKVYRAVKRSDRALLSVLEHGILKDAARAGFVPAAETSSLELSGDELILEVELVPHVTRPNEWSALQKRDAIAFLLSFSRYLRAASPAHFLHDPHVFNVTFKYGLPIYLDLGSLVPGEINQDTVHHLTAAFSESGLLDSCSNAEAAREALGQVKQAFTAGALAPETMLGELQAILDALQFSDDHHDTWSSYNQGIPATMEHYLEEGAKNAKTHFVQQKLLEVRPSRMIDLGSNDGWFAFFAAMLGTDVMAVDYVGDIVSRGHRHAQARGASVTFAVLDLIHLPVPMGCGGGYGETHERLRSEFCLAAAITHHLSKAGMSFEAQADLFAKFTEEYLAVEFIPREDRYVSQWGMPAWYTLDNYLSALSVYFDVQEIVESSPSPRKWIFAKRRHAARTVARPKRILLGQLGSNGDCLHATVLAKQIKHDYPDSHLTWAVSSLCRGMIDHNPDVDAIWEIPVPGWQDFAAAWYEFETTAQRLKAEGKYDEVILSQIYPGNYQNYDGTVRASVLRAYPRPITVPIQPTLRLTTGEVMKVRRFVEEHRLYQYRHVILFECASKSGQSFVTPEYALQVARALREREPEAAIVLSSHVPLVTSDPQIIDGSVLSLRETAELTKYCTLLVGCSSGVSCISITDWAKPLPMIQVLSGATSVYASFAHDHAYFQLPTEHVLEMADCSPNVLLNCIATALADGFPTARQHFHQDIPLDFTFYLQAIRQNLLATGQFAKVIQALLHAAERYGAHPQLQDFVAQELLPRLMVGHQLQELLDRLLEALTPSTSQESHALVLPDRRAFNFLYVFDENRLCEVLAAYLSAFAPGDDVCLHIVVPTESWETQAVIEAIQALGFSPEEIPDVSLVSYPLGNALFQAADIVLGDPRPGWHEGTWLSLTSELTPERLRSAIKQYEHKMGRGLPT